ncbi:MAG: LysR family transcriptional regulator [Bdellovibrionales bacterium]|nr:LysR family transcriptional regulator [Bdellovibrionales bacterium]
MNLLIDKLNLNQIRVFEAVYRTGSMTTAANELHLTQSGVSQHIKSLESSLEVTLFDRFNQRLVPTQSAKTLYETCAEGLRSIEKGLAEVTGIDQELTGTVGVGMPIEFGINVILPLISEFGKAHPQVKFEVNLGFASEMNDRLLAGSIDFAFIDDVVMSSPIDVEEVYEETLDLCVHPELIEGKDLPLSKADIENLSYIAYQRGEPLLHRWFQNHYQGKQIHQNVRMVVMDVQATAKLIATGFGAGVLPSYIVAEMKREGIPIVALKGSENPVINKIKLASLRQRSFSKSSKALLDFLKARL